MLSQAKPWVAQGDCFTRRREGEKRERGGELSQLRFGRNCLQEQKRAVSRNAEGEPALGTGKASWSVLQTYLPSAFRDCNTFIPFPGCPLLSARAKPSVVVRRGWQDAGSRRTAVGGLPSLQTQRWVVLPGCRNGRCQPKPLPSPHARGWCRCIGTSTSIAKPDMTSRKLKNSYFRIRMSSMQLDPQSSLIF